MKTAMPTARWCIALLLFGITLRAPAFETVVVDPGHGGMDEGTKWHHIAEKDLTLAVANRLVAVLRSKGIRAVQTRMFDCYVPLDDRATMANSSRNSLFVSLHFNAARSPSASGFQTFYFFASPSSRIIAGSIQDALSERLPGRSRGITRKDYAVLARTNDCAVLVECGFISNKAEATRYTTAEARQALAEALALGIMRTKPVINNDPPECEEAKCVIYAKKAEAAAKRLALGRSKVPAEMTLLP